MQEASAVLQNCPSSEAKPLEPLHSSACAVTLTSTLLRWFTLGRKGAFRAGEGTILSLHYPKIGMPTAQRILRYFILENSGSEYFSLYRKLVWDDATKRCALKLVDFGSYRSKVNLCEL